MGPALPLYLFFALPLILFLLRPKRGEVIEIKVESTFDGAKYGLKLSTLARLKPILSIIIITTFLAAVGCAPPDIGKLESDEDINGLIKAMGYNDGAYRDDAVRALRRIGTNAVDPLIKALDDRNRDVRLGAIHALGYIGDTRAVNPLVDALDGETFVEILEAIIWALGQIGDAQAIDSLIEIGYSDRHYFSQKEVVKALKNIGNSPGEDNFLHNASKLLDASFEKSVTTGLIKPPVFFMVQKDKARLWTVMFPSFGPSYREYEFIKANKVSEIQTIVAIRESISFEGYYRPSNTRAYSRIWLVRLVAWPGGVVLAEERFHAEPLSTFPGQPTSDKIVAFEPLGELIEWIVDKCNLN